MIKLLSYLKYQLSLIIFYIISAASVLTVLYLAHQEMVYADYIIVLLSFFFIVILIIEGIRFIRHRRILKVLSGEIYNVSCELPEPSDALEADYLNAIKELCRAYDSLKRRLETAHNDSLEYYTLWVHQIKTPIAALSLVLSQMDDAAAGIIKQELFKIEQYADLALRYVKLSDISSDLVIEKCSLDEIIHESVKKFGILFVYKKLSIDISQINKEVMSDKRWLMFIIEQVLSNALKYTQSGGISIYRQNDFLVVEDSGIGIRPEDLPRIFTKGYTGYNGRLDNRASGIGLYLTKKAADALSIRINVESKAGPGTRVTFTFPDTCADIFR